MTEADALRSAVVANPDDDTPRLIFADWLDEHGQPDRAAFIRMQIDAARAEPWSPAAREAEHRADAVYGLGQPDWKPDWAESLAVQYHRGFVEGITVDAHAFPQLAERVFEQFPLRTLTLSRPWIAEDGVFSNSLNKAFGHPFLRRIHRLELNRVNIAPEELYALSDSPHLADLHELSLSGNPLSVDWLVEFLNSRTMPNLNVIELAEIAHIGPALSSGLSKCSHRRFTKLDCSGIRLLFNELIDVLQSPALQAVEELHLRWSLGPNCLGPLTQIDMASVMPWRRLRRLDCTGQGFGSGGVEAITKKVNSETLRWLGLAANDIGADGVNWLLEARDLRLFALDVSRNGISGPRTAQLRRRFPEAAVVNR